LEYTDVSEVRTVSILTLMMAVVCTYSLFQKALIFILANVRN
jgi:hypothetical protein